jgi:hypothetical protein
MGAFPVIYLVIGIVLVTEAPNMVPPNGGQANGPPPEFIGWLFIGFATFAIVFSWLLAGALIVSGRHLSQRRGRTFCLITAGFCCLGGVLGIVLGVFTFIVLMRPSVRDAFEPSSADERDERGARDEHDTYHSD